SARSWGCNVRSPKRMSRAKKPRFASSRHELPSFRPGRSKDMRKLFHSMAVLAVLAATPVPLLAQTPKQGRAAAITFNNDFTTLDPQVGYDLQNYVAMRGIFDRLMDYRPGTVELVPSLAESYTISDDGKTYTFKLRDGVKFHNGRPLTSADVKYSL